MTTPTRITPPHSSPVATHRKAALSMARACAAVSWDSARCAKTPTRAQSHAAGPGHSSPGPLAPPTSSRSREAARAGVTGNFAPALAGMERVSHQSRMEVMKESTDRSSSGSCSRRGRFSDRPSGSRASKMRS